MSDFADLFASRSFGLVLPKDDEDAINRYVAMHSGERENFERRPFKRKIDFWAFSIVTAIAFDCEPRDGSVANWGRKFIETSQRIMNDELCSLLVVVAVARFGHADPEVGELRRIVDLANRLAGAGSPIVLAELEKEGRQMIVPLDRAVDLATSLQERVRSRT